MIKEGFDPKNNIFALFYAFFGRAALNKKDYHGGNKRSIYIFVNLKI